MTRDDTKAILMSIQAAFPNYKVPDKTVAINTWYSMLQQYEYKQVSTALAAYITTDTSGFAPSIGQIIAKIHMLTEPQEPNEMEAWALVSRAIKNGYYGAVDEFNKLPALVQKAVGSPDNLKNWATTDYGSIETVIQSNFLRTYRAVIARHDTEKRLPADIKSLIESINTQGIECKTSDSRAEIERKQDYSGCVPMPQAVKDRLEQMRGGGHAKD